MSHPHIEVLKSFYDKFSQGQFEAAIGLGTENVTFQVPGKSPIAGKFTRATFAQGYGVPLKERSGGTFKFEVHDILASDLHATVLGSIKLQREGRSIELRTVHVWRFEHGKPLAGYEYPRDLYQYDLIWS